MEKNVRRSHNRYLGRIIQRAGGSIPCQKVIENVCELEAFELERFLIQEIGRAPNGPLVNCTDGGDGVCGHVCTPEQLAAMSVARRGRALSAEARKKVSDTLKGRAFSDEHKAAISVAKKGKIGASLSEAHRRAIGDGNRGKKRSGVALESIRAAQRNLSPESRLRKSGKITLALTGKTLSESHRASISQAQKGRVRSEEFRIKVSAGVRALHNNLERDRLIMSLISEGLGASETGVCVGLSEAGVWSVRHRQRRLAQ